MATNLSDIGFVGGEEDLATLYSKIKAEDEKLKKQVDTLLYGTDFKTSANEDFLNLNIKPLDPSSEEYKDIANSWSNRLGAGIDSMYAMFNEGFGLLADQLGADETAASFRADAAKNLKYLMIWLMVNLPMLLTKELQV